MLVMWGDKYSSRHVNHLAKAARTHSSECRRVILFTDRIRDEVDPEIDQTNFPDFFNQEKFFRGGYIVKLSIFARDHLPPDTRCVYVDLDTCVLGDLGRIAALIKTPKDYAMLPPGNLIGFSMIRRLYFIVTGKRHFAVGNSSIVAYFSNASPNLCDEYQRIHAADDPAVTYTRIDDVFISRIAQMHLQGIPTSLAVMFRREFLARSSLQLWLRAHLPSRSEKRRNLVAITFNGVAYKPEEILWLKDGQRISDSKGRFGYWTAAHFGPVRDSIISFCKSVTGQA